MDSTVVKVNVGGTIFQTTLSTLQKAKYFSELALEPDLSNVMIDRCPRAFEYLLNCLRDRRYITPEKLHEYRLEMDYYGMDCLKAEAEQQVPTITVAKDSPYTIEICEGVPYLKQKETFTVTANQVLDTKISVSLPYDGFIQIHRYHNAAQIADIHSPGLLKLNFLSRYTFQADYCSYYLTFSRVSHVKVVTQQK